MKRWAAIAVLIAASAAPAQPAAGRRFALLVGVSDYEHPKLKKLAFAQQDAQDLAKVLETHKYKIELLCDQNGADGKPTLGNIRARLATVLRDCRKGDVVLIGLAGHGLQFAGEKDCYFCPSDAKPFAEERATLLSLQQLYRDLDRSNAGIKLLLVDACRDDPNGTRGVDADAAPRPPRGVAALFSCASGQRAFELKQYRHGVFFHHVIEGLKGNAKDADNDVTWHSLSGYVRKRVNKDVQTLVGNGARQEPHGIDEIVGDSPVLLSFGSRVALRQPTPQEPFAQPPALPSRRVPAEECLPDDTKLVVHVNVRQMVASPVLRPLVLEFTDSQPAGGQFAALLDLLKDTRTFYVAIPRKINPPVPPGHVQSVGIVQGNYQLATFREAFADAAAYQPFTVPGALAAFREKSSAFVVALLDGDMIAYAFLDEYLREVAAKRAGLRRAQYPPALRSIMATTNRAISMTVGFPDRTLWATAESEQQVPGVGKVGAFRLSAHFGNAIYINGGAGLSNPVDAEAFAVSTRAVVAKARRPAGKATPNDAAIAAFFKSARVETAGPTGSGVSLKASLTRDEIRPILDNFLKDFVKNFRERSEVGRER